MVAAHLDAVLAGVLHVIGVVARGVGGAFGGLDVDKLDFLVACGGAPIDILLVTRHVDTVVHQTGVAVVVEVDLLVLRRCRQ